MPPTPRKNPEFSDDDKKILELYENSRNRYWDKYLRHPYVMTMDPQTLCLYIYVIHNMKRNKINLSYTIAEKMKIKISRSSFFPAKKRLEELNFIEKIPGKPNVYAVSARFVKGL